MLETVDVEILSDSACERILAEKEESDKTEAGEDLQTVQASTFDSVKEIAAQKWFPWAVAGSFFVLWATKRKKQT